MCCVNSCELAMMPLFVTFQYSACNAQAEKMFPNFQVKVISSAFLLSALLTRVALSFALILLTLPWQNISVILKYHYNICSSDSIGLCLPVPIFFLERYY